MKIACLVVMVTCWAAIHGPASASDAKLASPKQSSGSAANAVGGDQGGAGAPVDHSKNPKSEDSSNEPALGRRASDKSHLHASSLMNPNRPKQVPTNRHNSKSRDAADFNQLGSDRTGSIRSETAKNAARIRPSSDARAGTPSLNNRRRGGHNPAAIDGSLNPRRRNSGEINGTHMTRKP
jgi:hypothetical protein